MIEKFNEILISSEGSDEKIQSYLKIKKELNNLIIDLNEKSKSNIKFIIENGEILSIKSKHQYSDVDLGTNNKNLIKLMFLNILSPLKTTEKYDNYYQKTERAHEKKEKELISNFITRFFELEKINKEKIIIEKEEKLKFIKEETNKNKKGETAVLYAQSIYQPSFELLQQLTTTIELIKNIEIEIITNQEEKTRNEQTNIILPMGKGKRHELRDAHLSPSLKNLIKNLYATDNQIYSININIIINMTRPLNFQEEIIIKDILKKNGIYTKTTISKEAKSITDFDFLMLLSNSRINI
jgi:hypothetical protein